MQTVSPAKPRLRPHRAYHTGRTRSSRRSADNTGGHLMQHGMVDLVIVGTDRTTRNGDVCNKIGTYLKALAAHDNGVAFYAAVPSSSIDWTSGEPGEIPIEERHGDEVRYVRGRDAAGAPGRVEIVSADSRVANAAF